MTTSIELPVMIEAIVTCPKCDDVIDVPLSLHGRLVADDDGTGSIKVRVVQKPIPHVCAQTRLDQVIPELEKRSRGAIS